MTDTTEVVINVGNSGWEYNVCMKRVQEIFLEHGQDFSFEKIDIAFRYNIDIGHIVPNNPYQERSFATRSHPYLVQAVKELGLVASAGSCSKLAIVEVPTIALPSAHINEYDGGESIEWNVSVPLIKLLLPCDVESLTLEEAKTLILKLQAIAVQQPLD